MKILLFTLLFIVVFAYHRQGIASSIHKVIYIYDGDTIITKDTSNREYKIRLAGIDAPEDGQHYGNKSTEALKSLISNKMIKVVLEPKRDRYKRYVGRLYLNNLDINKEMIRLGAAWHEKRYTRGKTYRSFLKSEYYAQKNRLGLWRYSEPMPPWVWRRLHK